MSGQAKGKKTRAKLALAQDEHAVTVVGGGQAGLTAALRLAERGYTVTLLERSELIGGQFGIVRHGGIPHEHCYHMFCNWYHNFWDIVDTLDIRDRFLARPTVKFLRPGEYPGFKSLTNVGDPEFAMQNLNSGLLSLPDMFIYGYSMVDLISQSFSYSNYLDRHSVNGFLGTRQYGTAAAAREYQEVLAKAFAVAPYRTSAISYKKFLQFGFRMPSPMMWVLDGDCYSRYLQPLREHLQSIGVTIVEHCQVTGVTLSDAGKVQSIRYRYVPEDSLYDSCSATPEGADPEFESAVSQLVLAVPPGAVSKLVDANLLAADRNLGKVRNLRSVPVASIDLYFSEQIEGIPSEHVVMLNSRYGLSFVDQSQTWLESPHGGRTFLNLVASEFAELEPLEPDQILKYVLQDLARYLPAHMIEKVDWERTYLRKNIGESIFINEVGSWESRPQAATAIENLFLAGDYCRSVVDVTTLEGATMTGLLAAEALRARTKPETVPIEIKEPQAYPDAAMQAMKLAGWPYAMGAKMASTALDRFVR